MNNLNRKNALKALIASSLSAFGITFCSGLFSHVIAQTSSLVIYDQNTGKFAKNLDMGVDTSERRRDWIDKRDGNIICMAYPSGQNWGATFITEGKPRPKPRPFRDLSNYSNLVIEMRGEKGGEEIAIAIKDRLDPDDGSETKETVSLTPSWKMYTFPLQDFHTANLKELYVMTSFIFEPDTPSRTVCFRRIEYQS